MKEDQSQTTQPESPELIKDSPPLVANYMAKVKRHNLLEKGIVTQAEIDQLMNKPIWEPSSREVKQIILKIFHPDKPWLEMGDIE